MHDIFMSYSRHNRQRVSRLARDLEDHGVSVWMDSIELTVGDKFHRKIEDAIANSRYFCLALSDAALASYYVREVEFEQAFARMSSERRNAFILPIRIGRVRGELPLRLRNLFYLDFTRKSQYTENMRALVNKVKGVPEDFSGSRWYKGLNISNLGEAVGIGSVAQMATLGHSYEMRWRNGKVERVDVYSNGHLANFKKFGFDDRGRVIENKMYSRSPDGEWTVQDDVWYYEYDPSTGSRSKKTMRYEGERTARVVYYDSDGVAVEERIETTDGWPADRQFPYARKHFLYDEAGNPSGERWFDDEDVEITPSRTGD